MSLWKRISHALLFAVMAFLIFGPLLNLFFWAVAEKWYYPHKLPLEYGFKYWELVFHPRGNAMEALGASLAIAIATVLLCLLISIPAGYALARRSLPVRGLIMLMFLLPQAFPSLAVYMNIARVFYQIGLNGTMTGVVLVHTVHGLVYSVWITTAAFAAVDHSLELAARNLGASPLYTFVTVTLPQALPGVIASAIFVFLESLDEFTGTFFVGVPDINTLPLLLFSSSMGGNYQIASISALILLVPSVTFMVMVDKFFKADVLAKMGA